MKVFVGTPTISGDVCHEYVLSLVANLYDLNRHGIELQPEFRPGCSLIGLARAELLDLFLKSDCTDLLFIDADLCMEATGMRKVLTAQVDGVICGAYPYKQDREEYPAKCVYPGEKPRVVNGCIEMLGAAGGFMRVRREVFTDLMTAYPERRFDNGDGSLWDFFSCERKDGMLRGEDYNFCELWRGIGGKVWVVPDISFIHVGRKGFPGNFHQFLLRQPGGSENPISNQIHAATS